MNLRSPATRATATLLCLLIGGCVMNGRHGAAPTASGDLAPPAGIVTESVFACAERSVIALHAKNQFWNTRITRRDPGDGALETGDFPDDNIGGFRVRLLYPSGASQVKIAVKGAGPYYSDLGVDQALDDFKAELARCLTAL